MAKKREQGESQNNSQVAATQTKAVQANSKSEDVITLDLQNFLTPIAIIIAGMMVSVTLFFSLKDAQLGSDVKGTSDTTTSAGSNPTDSADTAPAPTQEGFAAAEITIDDDPVLGDKGKAKVAIVEFSDYECPFCQRHYSETHGQILDKYISTGDVVMVYRDMPLSFHPQAKPAAIAANCAGEQGGDSKYYEYHDLLFGSGVANGESDFDKYAEQLGLDMGKFNECQTSGKFDQEIADDIADGNAEGCTGTPCFIIGELDADGNVVNGKKISGAYPFSSFQQVIDELL